MNDSRNDNPTPQIKPISPPMDVPVFNVIIHVSSADGQVVARVANLPDLCFRASSEPMALKKAITDVKQKLAAWVGQGESIPWLKDIQLLEGEQQRMVPVHL